MDYDVMMTMEMYGNDHVYAHNIDMYFITQNRINIIPCKLYEGNFILKLIVDDRYDLNGTNYIRYHIIKQTNPEFDDILTEAVNNDDADYYNLKDTCKSYKQPEDEPTKPKDPSKSKCPKTREAMKDEKQAKELKEKYEKAMEDYNRKVAAIKEQQNKNRDAINTINRLLTKYERIVFEDDLPKEAKKVEESAVNCRDDIITFVKPSQGRIFKYYKKNEYNVTRFTTDVNNFVKFDKELLNKIATKMILLPQLDKDTLRNLCGYINREAPGLDMCEHVVPLIAKAIQKVANTEMGILFLQNTKLFANINDMKSNKYKAMPNSLYEAFKSGQLVEYISYMLRDTLSVNEQNPTTFKVGF
jgi:ubiquitin